MRVERQIEFFRRDLRQRGEDALAEFDLAGEDGDGAVRIDAQPGIEPAVARQAARAAARARCARARPRNAEGDDDAAARRR